MSRPLSDDAAHRWRYFHGLLLCLVGAAIGLRLPDFDQAFFLPPLLMHRSLVFHSFLFPLLLFVWASAIDRRAPESVTVRLSKVHADPRVRLFTLGFSLALAVHLSFDLFPYSWRGWALVHVPLWGRLSPLGSELVMAVSVFLSLFLACRLLRAKYDLIPALLCLAGTYGVCAQRELRSAIGAFLVLTVLSLFAFIVSSQRTARLAYASGESTKAPPRF